jgi:hypothetical protein
MAGPFARLGAACQTQPGSNRQVSNAIHTIAIIRAKHQPETRAYLDRRIAEGKTTGAQNASAGSARRHHLRAVIANGNHLAPPRLVGCVCRRLPCHR